MITSAIDISSVFSVSRNEARIVGVRSSATSRLMAAGIEARSCGNSARTSSTVSIMLAPGWRFRITSTDGLPLAEPALRTLATESITLATSLTRTAAPLR